MASLRGAALGVLLGLAHGNDTWPARWAGGLTMKEEIAREVDAFGKHHWQASLDRSLVMSFIAPPRFAADIIAP